MQQVFGVFQINNDDYYACNEFVAVFEKREDAETFAAHAGGDYERSVVKMPLVNEVTKIPYDVYTFEQVGDDLIWTVESKTHMSIGAEDNLDRFTIGGIYPDSFEGGATVITPTLQGDADYCRGKIPEILARFREEVVESNFYPASKDQHEWHILKQESSSGEFYARRRFNKSSRIDLSVGTRLHIVSGDYGEAKVTVVAMEPGTRVSKKGNVIATISYRVEDSDGNEFQLKAGQHVRELKDEV